MAPAAPRSEVSAQSAATMTKKCPFCFTYLSLDARRCHTCGKRVGPVTKEGLAVKPTNVRSYIVAAFCILVAAVFFWWAFMVE
jgi:hypothetical protein